VSIFGAQKSPFLQYSAALACADAQHRLSVASSRIWRDMCAAIMHLGGYSDKGDNLALHGSIHCRPKGYCIPDQQARATQFQSEVAQFSADFSSPLLARNALTHPTFQTIDTASGASHATD
jgi:hypothetical protein